MDTKNQRRLLNLPDPKALREYCEADVRQTEEMFDYFAKRANEMPSREPFWLIVVAILMLLAIAFLAGCGCSNEQEFKVNGEWRSCEFIEERQCGVTLRCGESLIECQTDLESRGQCK